MEHLQRETLYAAYTCLDWHLCHLYGTYVLSADESVIFISGQHENDVGAGNTVRIEINR